MDSVKLILTETVGPPIPLENLNKIGGLQKNKKKQFAKDLESVFLNKLMEEMQNTIGEWGFEKDGASRQVQGIFWLHLARDIADKGGLGLWKDIYQFLTGPELKNATAESLDNNV